jgi:poly-gamma-glutamate synthesis protein (capsule biosynthesis protein)
MPPVGSRIPRHEVIVLSVMRGLIAVLLAIALACGGAPRISATTAPEPTSAPDAATIPDAATGGLSIFAGGDVQFDGLPGEMALREGDDYPFALVGPLLDRADLRLANLECVLADSGTKLTDKKYTFRGDPRLVGALQGRFDIISLANNHTLDCGVGALAEMQDHLDAAGLLTAGAGRNREAALRPLLLEVNGLKVAVISHSDLFAVPWKWKDYWAAGENKPGVAVADWETLVPAVESAAKGADIVIVMLHWGYEYIPKQADAQVALAHRLIDCGADLIIGSHPHIAQPMEVYRGRLITYSLGNFVMNPGRPPARDALVVNVDLASDGALRSALVTPIRYDTGRPRPATADEAQELRGRILPGIVGARVDTRSGTAFTVTPR